MSFSNFINEAEASEDVATAVQNIKNIIDKNVPKGWKVVRDMPSLAGNGMKVISIAFGFVGDKSKLTSGILENDPTVIKMMVHPSRDGSYSLEALSSSFMVKPEPGSFMAMGSKKVPFRKVKGDLSKIEKGFEKWLKKYTEAVKSNKEDIYGYEKYKEFF